MRDTLSNRTLALAGIVQAASMTQQLARRGQTDKTAFNVCVHSLLRIDAPTAEAVFDGKQGVALGLELLYERFGRRVQPADVEIARYLGGIIYLEASLHKRSDIQEGIRQGIQTAQERMKFFAPAEADTSNDIHPRLVEMLAELYTQTLSSLTPRIIVSGEHGYLSTPAIAAKVRVCLFAGVRAAVLWRQLGGSRWQLVLGRRRIAGAAAEILKALDKQ